MESGQEVSGVTDARGLNRKLDVKGPAYIRAIVTYGLVIMEVEGWCTESRV